MIPWRVRRSRPQRRGVVMMGFMNGEGHSVPKTNRKFAPENGWLEDYVVSFWGVLGLFSGMKC